MMTDYSEIIQVKYPGIPMEEVGWTPRSDGSGILDITSWPSGFGPMPTLADLDAFTQTAAWLDHVKIQRESALRVECESYIDTSIVPNTRSMLHDGVLDAATAEDIREFIAACYDQANSVMDAIEAAETVVAVGTPSPVWPVYGA